MRDFRKKLPKWTAIPLGDNSYDGGGGRGRSKPSWIELLSLDSESTQERSNSILSVWKPDWYTGWHTGVLACGTSAVVVLFINVGLTIYASTNRRYNVEGRIGTFYSGSCDKSKTIGLWLHLGINGLSTLLLSGSNYTQQCLSAPTRSEIDAAHAKREWMDIGVPSVRNLFKIKPERTLLWIAIGVMSIPLHLLYNSAVYTSLAANDFLITVVTNNHFEKGAYTNTTIEPIDNFRELSLNAATGKKYGEIGYQVDLPDIQLFSSMLEGYNISTGRYKDLKPLECIKAYNTDFVSSRRNLFLITKNSSNTTNNNTVLDMIRISSNDPAPASWICTEYGPWKSDWCDTNRPIANLTSGLPWRVGLTTGEVVDIARCKSEVTDEKCKVQFSLEIMIIVICCNLVKAYCMITAVVRSHEPTLVTLGDAVESFLRAPDPTTKGMCFADREFIRGEWKHWWRTRPRKWKQKGLQRWWTSVGRAKWVTCYFFCLSAIFYLAVALVYGMQKDGQVWSMDFKSMWTRGLGTVSGVSLLASLNPSHVTLAILLSNIPQTILSFLYLTYNSLFTCMLSAHEWSLFSHHHRSLRVTSPLRGQRSTYWLQIPYTYAIPLMTLSGLLHWLASQSLFFARVDLSDPFGRNTLEPINAVGYSCIAIIFALMLGIFALLSAAGMGYRQFAAEITTVGDCSAAISAACHASEENSDEIIGKKLRWGDVGVLPNMVVSHLTFSSEEGVKKPVFGAAYAGMVGKGSDYL